MAYAALAPLRRTLEEITLNPDQYSIDLHHIDLIRSINERITFLQEFADKFPEEADRLEGRIVDVGKEAQDVVEHFISKQIRSRLGRNSCVGFRAKSRRGAKFQQQLEKIREVIDSIAGKLMEMEKNGHEIEDEKLSDSPAASPSSVIAVRSNVVGLDDDSLAIKSRLCGGSLKLQVIPIVGMGGIGKTNLCTHVYNDPLTVQYFDVRAWVTVSQDYSTHKIVSSLVYSVREFVMKKTGESDEETVYKSLRGRRYLIVVDDIWSTNAWDDLSNMFPNDHNGSRVMLTTRLYDVAAYAAGYSPLHEMRFMGVEQSWVLLRQRVFANQDCPPELENIGKEIAKSCRGLPLAILVIAGLLCKVERNSFSWKEMAKSVSSTVVTEHSQIDKILSLSYTHLPHHLRPCFLYMGGFPEDHEIHLSQLVKLWVAEGFLRCSEGSSRSLEEEAEECLEDLVSRSLVLVTKRKYDGRIKSCSLHDLIRDLCIRKAKENNFFLHIKDRFVVEKHDDSLKDQNRISAESLGTLRRNLSGLYCSTIRTIMCITTNIRYHPTMLDFLKSVRLLRVLDAKNDDFESLPDALFKLFHLRYLAIGSRHGFMTIPAAILNLQNLQTLIINASGRTGRQNVDCLPQEIWMMPQLRHLICYGKFPSPKQTTVALGNLQTLYSVSHDICVEGTLEKFPNIKKLGIDCSYYDIGTHLNNLEQLHQLECLELGCADWRKDSICFPRMLRKLTLCNMSLLWSELSVVGSLPNLEVLKLRDLACIGSTWETSEGEFPQLQYLLIKYSKLQYWKTEEHHFPRLKFLLLHDCGCLNEIPEAIGDIPTLELIDVRGFYLPISLVESAQRIQEEQESLGNDVLQVYYPRSKFDSY